MLARRSCLSVPGSAERMLAKLGSLEADEFVLDLEDAVVPRAKDDARRLVVATLAGDAPARRGVMSVRINAPRSPWCHRDVIALADLQERPDTMVVPKVESAGDLAFVERLLDGAEAAAGRRRPIRLQALIETAAGLARIQEIAAASERLDALILGYADLAASLGRSARAAQDLETWRPAQEALLLAARANGLQAIDGPYLGTAPDAGFEAAARRARDLGFDGKWAIHPSQVGVLNDLFTPSAEELERARAVVAVLEQAERDGRGAVSFEGEMVDEAVRVAALRTVARAQ
jgi:citrate lyase subunit beta/citryl-CoA lyase